MIWLSAPAITGTGGAAKVGDAGLRVSWPEGSRVAHSTTPAGDQVLLVELQPSRVMHIFHPLGEVHGLPLPLLDRIQKKFFPD